CSAWVEIWGGVAAERPVTGIRRWRPDSLLGMPPALGPAGSHIPHAREGSPMLGKPDPLSFDAVPAARSPSSGLPRLKSLTIQIRSCLFNGGDGVLFLHIRGDTARYGLAAFSCTPASLCSLQIRHVTPKYVQELCVGLSKTDD